MIAGTSDKYLPLVLMEYICPPVVIAVTFHLLSTCFLNMHTSEIAFWVCALVNSFLDIFSSEIAFGYAH